MAVGKKIWVIAEGHIPKIPGGGTRALNHETACIVNTSEKEANIDLYIYFASCDPAGPYLIKIPAQRTYHLRFNELKKPKPIPEETDFSSVFISDIPVVIQHTRIAQTKPGTVIMTTTAYKE